PLEGGKNKKSPALSEDITMSLKTALLVALILALSYQHGAALNPGIPKECCNAYRTGKPLPYTMFKSYYWTNRDCFLNAVVLITKMGKRTCFNPAERWVRQTMRRLQENKCSRKWVLFSDSNTFFSECGGRNHSEDGMQDRIPPPKYELTNLMVTQTPDHSEEKEGANVTIECRFRTVSNYSTMYVRWYKDGQNLTRERDSLTIIQDLEKGFVSLTLKNMKEVDSGFYVCEVGSRSRNLSGSGTPSHIVITGHGKKPPVLNHTVTGAGAGVGAGVGAGGGVVLLALLIGIFVWRRKQSSKGTPLTTSEPESVSTKNVRTQHLPLASQASDVTYADLNFNKRDVKPDAEVVYAEVKVGRKQTKEP
ncbi:hypothetical protein lerEdw1_001041, partial [Lerista edwardsae]